LLQRGYCHRTSTTPNTADSALVVTLVTTGQLAAELGVSRSAVLKWHRAGLITPELITPGNHLRWDAERVREQLRARRQRDE
jgi:predicted site-specific integrase-resolvase